MACELCKRTFGEPCESACLRVANIKARGLRHARTVGLRRFKPIKSMTMAVNVGQLDLAKKLDRERGAPPTEYAIDREGYTAQPVFTSEQHKRKFAYAHGMRDRSAYC